MTAELQN